MSSTRHIIAALKTLINLASGIDATKVGSYPEWGYQFIHVQCTWALYILTISVLSDWFYSVPACTGITGKTSTIWIL